ncbi:hypothetical protein SKAU_G00155960 [Synaphobranchus kaupii]|uniref:Uncharacterized protein n=1 Tax=Synaphobranchus kaupii TaxID=118154 RepID=A0A9Q1IYD1_SYNKA|nr:hypothetical protein SKAU_G00155960 [Synaphobranchus kaupii]
MSSVDEACNDPVDRSFQPPSSTSTSSPGSGSTSARSDHPVEWDERKSCQRCGIPIEDINVIKHASKIKVEWRCLNGHQDKWSSCPDTRGMAENNLLISSATLFTGTTYTEIVDWAGLLNLQIPQKTQYYAIQSTYLIPELIRRWKSLLHHICGVHRWEEDGVNYTCHHRSLTPDEQRRKKWLQPDSPAYKALSSVVLDKKLLLDLKQMENFKHTGALEVYHSAMLKYAPKRLHFNYDTMRARTQLTILDHNSNVGRPQAVTEAGTMRYSIAFPKQTKDWVAKKLYVPTTQAFRKHLVELVLERRRGKTVKYKDPASKVQLPPRPANIANVPQLPKAEVVARSRSRFKVNEEEND